MKRLPVLILSSTIMKIGAFTLIMMISCHSSLCLGFCFTTSSNHHKRQSQVQILNPAKKHNDGHIPFATASQTRLHSKKWGPRWNPTPDSEYYRRGNDFDSDYNRIHFSGNRRRNNFTPTFSKLRVFSLQRFLVVMNVLLFIKQIQSSINNLPALNNLLDKSGYPYDLFTKFDIILEQFVLGSAPTVVEGKAYPITKAVPIGRNRAYGNSLIVASTLGPFTMDFVNQRLLTRIQPHRYLTSGFLHGSLIHLLFNMNYLWKIPRWVENNGGSGNKLLGSGWCLYLTTYLTSIIGGNIVRDYFTTTSVGMSSLCLGASGGICGLNGLMFVMLQRMGHSAASLNVLKNMAFMILFGALSSGISNASHIGGFLCGTIVGYLFGPNYRKGYSSRRWNFDDSEAPLDYKVLMGSGVEPDRPNVPLKYLFACFGLVAILRSELWIIPEYIWKGFTSPGALSGMVVSKR